MCLDAEQTSDLVATLEELQQQLTTSGFASFTPNRSDDVGRRDEDFQPLNEMHQIIQSSKNRSTKQILAMVKKVLSRHKTDPDLLGACYACEECIAPARLKIFPYAMYCVKCQTQAESRGHGRSGRRNLTDFEH